MSRKVGDLQYWFCPNLVASLLFFSNNVLSKILLLRFSRNLKLPLLCFLQIVMLNQDFSLLGTRYKLKQVFCEDNFQCFFGWLWCIGSLFWKVSYIFSYNLWLGYDFRNIWFGIAAFDLIFILPLWSWFLAVIFYLACHAQSPVFVYGLNSFLIGLNFSCGWQDSLFAGTLIFV